MHIILIYCFVTQFGHKGTTFFLNMQTFLLFFIKIGHFFLHMCQKSSTFAADLVNNNTNL